MAVIPRYATYTVHTTHAAATDHFTAFSAPITNWTVADISSVTGVIVQACTIIFARDKRTTQNIYRPVTGCGRVHSVTCLYTALIRVV